MSEQPSPYEITLHGIGFESEGERQAAAEGHPLWAHFVDYAFRKGYSDYPNMGTGVDRELFEAYVGGGMAMLEISVK